MPLRLLVEEKDIEIIIMGAKGKTGSRKIVYGNIGIILKCQ